MTAYRLVTRSIWWMLALVVVAGQSIALLAAGGARWAATALALDILIFPFAMLALALFAKVLGGLTAGRQRAEAPEAEHRQLTKILLFLAAFGILSVIVLTVAAGLTETGEGWERVAGYAVVFVYAALVMVMGGRFALMMLVPALPLRISSRFGKRKGWFAAALCTRANRLDEAWEIAERYRAEHPDDSKGLNLQAFIRLRQGRVDEALELADRAVGTDRTAEALVTRSRVWAALGGAEEALADAEEALALNPKAPLAEAMVGAVLIGLRRIDDAIARLHKPKSPYFKSISLFTLAEAARLRGWPDAAEETYRQVTRFASIERRLGSIDSQGLQAIAWARLGKRAEAEKYARLALARDDSDELALHTLAILAFRRDDRDAAYAALERLLPHHCGEVVAAFSDTEFTPVLAEMRFRRLFAWAVGAREQTLRRVRARRAAGPSV